MEAQRKASLRTMALLLRFRTNKPTIKQPKYVTYRRIAQALNLTCYEVQHICRTALRPPKKMTSRQLVRKLDD